MIKLNAAVSRKIGLPNFGSRGASVALEMELESQAVQDPSELNGRIRQLFAQARTAVDEELRINCTPADSHAPSGPGNVGQAPAAASANGSRPATDKQTQAIWGICTRMGLDPDQEASALLGRHVAQLSVVEASRLIEALTARRQGA